MTFRWRKRQFGAVLDIRFFFFIHTTIVNDKVPAWMLTRKQLSMR